MWPAGDDQHFRKSPLDFVDRIVSISLREKRVAQPVDLRAMLLNRREVIGDGVKLIEKDDIVVGERRRLPQVRYQLQDTEVWIRLIVVIRLRGRVGEYDLEGCNPLGRGDSIARRRRTQAWGGDHTKGNGQGFFLGATRKRRGRRVRIPGPTAACLSVVKEG